MTVRQVQVLATAQIVEGSLELMGGLIFGLSPGGTGSAELWIAMSLAGLAVALIGLLRIVAGVLTFSFRGRAFGMATLAVGLLSGLTCCCLPTSLALCVYGFVVYMSADVQRAFAQRAAGASVEDVLAP